MRDWISQRPRVVRLSLEAAWIAGGQALAVAGMLVGVRVMTEWLSPRDYGFVALSLTLVTLVQQVLMGGLGQGIARFYSIAKDAGAFGPYMRASLRLMIFASIATLAVGLLLSASVLGSQHGSWLTLMAASTLFALFSGWNGNLSGFQNAARQRKIVAFHAALDAWLRVLLALAFMRAAGASATAVILGYAASSAVATFSQLLFLRRLGDVPSMQERPRESGASWETSIWQFSWPSPYGASSPGYS